MSTLSAAPGVALSARASARGSSLRSAAAPRVVSAAATAGVLRVPAAAALSRAKAGVPVSVTVRRAAARGVAVRTAAVAPRAAAAAGPRTLFDKIWDEHVVECAPDGTCLLYIDRHLVHEVTSPQAFEGLRNAGRTARRPDMTLATADHNVPTSDRSGFTTVESFIKEVESRTQARPARRQRHGRKAPLPDPNRICGCALYRPRCAPRALSARPVRHPRAGDGAGG